MQYDKYGDPIENTTKMTKQRKTAFMVVMLIQILIILLNIVVMIVPAINGYLCFVLAPFYLFVLINYIKTLTPLKDDGLPVTKHYVFTVVSIVLYLATAVLCILA